jgi:hypothetical protein
MALPKTVEGVRKALRDLEGDDVVISFSFNCYDHRSPGALYLSQDWHAMVHLETEGINLSCNGNSGPELLRKIKAEILAERKRIAEAKRITHQPKLLEYRPENKEFAK